MGAAETSFSSFRRICGELCISLDMDSIYIELADNVCLYNMMINLQG